MNIIKCPVCGEILEKGTKEYTCKNSHLFDIAKQGHTNLLLNKDKNSKNPGDSKEMLHARRDFLDKGHYEYILEELEKKVIEDIEVVNQANNDALSIIDIGCGEGYYLSKLKENLAEKIGDKTANYFGIDISKEGIKLATRRDKNVEWFVANSFNLPFMDKSIDYIISMFSFINIDECQRVLKDKGKMILVTAQKEHLKELKEIIYPAIKEKRHEVENIKSENLLKSEDFFSKVTIDSNDDLWNLLSMTPHYWKSKIEHKNLLKDYDSLEITININISIFSN